MDNQDFFLEWIKYEEESQKKTNELLEEIFKLKNLLENYDNTNS